MTVMVFQKVRPPAEAERIRCTEGKLVVPNRPIVPFIHGDGIGQDISPVTQRIVDAAVQKAYGGQRQIAWFRVYAGDEACALYDGVRLPSDTVQAIAEFLVAIKGPLTTAVGKGEKSLNVALRQLLDLYACVRPVRYFQGVPAPVKEPQKVDMVIFRENTEDVYAGIEWPAGSEGAQRVRRFLAEDMAVQLPEDAGIGIKPISREKTRRLVRAAIQHALEHGRKSVTLVHKGNIMKYTEGAFRDWGYELAVEEFADQVVLEKDGATLATAGGKLLVNDRIADSMFQQVLLRPDEYSVAATPNLNGDYLSDALAAQVGGLGIAPGANINFVTGHGLFEATHGTAPKHAGLDKANPGSLLLSAVMMLEYMGWNEAAKLITGAYAATIQQGVVTYDFARQMTGATEVKCSAFGEAIVERME